jgi:aminoglycoside phosphotransferase (APT) family kinase protein
MEFFDEKIRDYISSNTNLKYEFEYEQFKVGRSNITFKIFDDSNVLVLRRPPFGNKLESAHNMQREFKIITELSKNNLKVPKPILLCVDRLICDDDFYIMEYIEGETIADNLIAEKYSDLDKEKITESFISTLVELHFFDVEKSSLKDLGKHENYVERQLNRWSKQFNAQKVRDISDLDIATKLLFDNMPSQQKVSIVHGDYRLDNVRINNNSVAAVVDWELCTLGDPLADLGTVIASWADKNEKNTPFIYSPSLSDGFPSRKNILTMYENKSELNLDEIEFYVRLSFWKHAMIMEGVFVRYSLGYYGNVDKKDVEAFGESTLNFAKKASTKNLLKEIL